MITQLQTVDSLLSQIRHYQSILRTQISKREHYLKYEQPNRLKKGTRVRIITDGWGNGKEGIIFSNNYLVDKKGFAEPDSILGDSEIRNIFMDDMIKNIGYYVDLDGCEPKQIAFYDLPHKNEIEVI